MAKHTDITTLNELLDRIAEAIEGETQVSLQMVVEATGGRSFGPLLMIPALVLIAPGVGDIPGVTTTCAVIVLIIAGQLLFKRKHLWLPQWLLKLSVKRERVSKAIRWVRRPAKFVDRLIHHRLARFASPMAIAIGCTAVALVMPLMEVVPLGGMVIGAALAAYGLALIAHDGLVAIFAYAFSIGAVAAAGYFLL
jgi:hypothetical protein